MRISVHVSTMGILIENSQQGSSVPYGASLSDQVRDTTLPNSVLVLV